MKLPEKALRVRIYTGEDDKYDGRPVHEALVEEARRAGLAGATVIRGAMGFGANSRVHTSKILRLSQDLPVITEIVDKPEKIESFLPVIDKMLGEGLVVTEEVRTILYRFSERQKG
jgi:hypothetical protein